MDEKAERKAHRQAVALDQQRQTRLDDFVRAALGTREGREYFYWLMEISRVGRTPFHTNAMSTSFACGQFSIGNQVQEHLLEISPEGYLLMLKEKKDERLILDAAIAAAGSADPYAAAGYGSDAYDGTVSGYDAAS